jgi:hypothetical protein
MFKHTHSHKCLKPKIQGILKLVIQKSAVMTSELEVTIWSGTFQKLHLVLKFSSKWHDGIPLMQSYLEILPVIMDWMVVEQ